MLFSGDVSEPYSSSVWRAIASHEYAPPAAARARSAIADRAAGSDSSSCSAARSAGTSPAGNVRAAPVAASSGNPPTSLSSSGTPAPSAVNSDARLVDLAIGQHDEVGALRSRRRSLGVADEPRHEADVRRGRRRRRVGDVELGHAHHPQLGVVDLTPRVEQQVETLVGAHQAEEQHDGPVRLQSAAAGAVPSARWAKHPVRDDVHARGVDAQLAGQPGATVRGVDDDRVEPLIQPPLRGELPGTGFAGQDVVRGEHERAPGAGLGRAPGGQQMTVEVLDGQPLEMHDVGLAGEATVAQHVGDVLGEL